MFRKRGIHILSAYTVSYVSTAYSLGKAWCYLEECTSHTPSSMLMILFDINALLIPAFLFCFITEKTRRTSTQRGHNIFLKYVVSVTQPFFEGNAQIV